MSIAGLHSNSNFFAFRHDLSQGFAAADRDARPLVAKKSSLDSMQMFNRYLIIFLVSSIRFVLNIIDFSRDVHQSMFK